MVFFITRENQIKDANSSLQKIVEGRFQKGKISGYARELEVLFRKCKVGFFNDDEPSGKFQSFNLDGKCTEEGFKRDEARRNDAIKREV